MASRMGVGPIVSDSGICMCSNGERMRFNIETGHIEHCSIAGPPVDLCTDLKPVESMKKSKQYLAVVSNYWGIVHWCDTFNIWREWFDGSGEADIKGWALELPEL